ncbi:MAG: hypothetical protein RLZZ156_1852 [Deinococcota bacterium]
MKHFVFCDLDNTIIRHQSRVAQTEINPVVGVNEFGLSSTVMTKADTDLYKQALEFGEIIPTTGRSMAEYQRLHALIPSFQSWAVLNHGATLLYQNQVDQLWLKRITSAIQPMIATTLQIYQMLLSELDLSQQKIRLHQEHSLPLYISVRCPRDQDYSAIQNLLESLLQSLKLNVQYSLLHTGRISSILPNGINKKDAVLEVMNRLKQSSKITTLGIGDSLTDLPFMQLCDQMRYPSDSEIALMIQTRGAG